MLKIGLKTVDTHTFLNLVALLDCGATGLFIDRAYVRRNNITMRKLEHPVPVYNIDGTENVGGTITEEVTMIMSYQGHQERAVFEVCDLGKTDLIIGFTWLQKHNPEINWRTGEVQMTRCPRECNVTVRKLKKQRKQRREKKRVKEQVKRYPVTMEEVPDEDMPNGEDSIMIEEANDRDSIFRHIRSNGNKSSNPVEGKSAKELVPEKYHEYLSVFEKKESERMPLRKPWDHGIELKEGFMPKKSKVYPLSPKEQEEVDSF
jgi:hypothetical protein